MLLGRPWLTNAKVAHYWGNNIVTIQGNGTIRTIIVTKHLGGEVRRPEVLLCYNYQNGIINEEENIMFATKLELFSLGTINLLDIIWSIETTDVYIMDTSDKTSNSELKSTYRSHNRKQLATYMNQK